MPRDKVRLLCALNRRLLREFSRRTLAALEENPLFRLALPPFRSLLEANLRKELEKDRRVLACAARAQGAGRDVSGEEIRRLLREAREIDGRFLRRAAPLPIDIDYREVEAIRRQRFELMTREAGRLLGHWDRGRHFRQAVADLYGEGRFRALLRELLHLYALETRALGHSLRMPGIATPLRDTLGRSIQAAMESVADGLAVEISRRIYGC